MTYYQHSKADLIGQRKALLQAVRVLSNHGHHCLAQQLWDASANLKQQRVVLPGEDY